MSAQRPTAVPDFTITRGNGVPVYVQIRDAMRALIQARTIPSGAVLPPENRLAEQLEVSRMTLRQALADLEREGLIDRVQGIGTTVRVAKLKHETKHLTSFSEDIGARGLVPSSKVLSVGRVPAPARVSEALGLEPETPVDRIHRVRFASGQPVGVHTSHLLPGLVEPGELSDKDSLYTELERRGTVPATAEESLEAIAASTEEAALLNVERGAPLLLVTRTTFDLDGRPFEVVFARYRADTYQYTVSLKRPGLEPS